MGELLTTLVGFLVIYVPEMIIVGILGLLAAAIVTPILRTRLLPGLSGLQQDATTYVNTTLPKILADWDWQALQATLSPQFRAVTPLVTSLHDSFDTAHDRLGTLKQCQCTSGRVELSRQGAAEGDYIINAEFESGPASICLHLIRSNNQWFISSFRINTSGMMPVPC